MTLDSPRVVRINARTMTLAAIQKRFVVTGKLLDVFAGKTFEDTPEGLRFTMIASVPARDRSGEKVLSTAWRWREPLPKVHWGHNTRDPNMVIGKLTRVWVENDALMVEGLLNDRVPGAKTAQLIADFVRNGSVNQGSVGFLAEAWTEGNGRKVVGHENYMGPRKDRTYTDVEFIEMTLTTIPDQARSIITSFKDVVTSLGLEESAASDEATQDLPPADTTEAPAPAEVPPVDSTPAEKSKAPEPTWLDRLFGTEPAEHPGAALSRAQKDRLVQVRDALASHVQEIDAVLQSAERADGDEPQRPAPQAQGGA